MQKKHHVLESYYASKKKTDPEQNENDQHTVTDSDSN